MRAPSNNREIASNGRRYLLKRRVPITLTVSEGSEDSICNQGVLEITREIKIINHNAINIDDAAMLKE